MLNQVCSIIFKAILVGLKYLSCKTVEFLSTWKWDLILRLKEWRTHPNRCRNQQFKYFSNATPPSPVQRSTETNQLVSNSPITGRRIFTTRNTQNAVNFCIRLPWLFKNVTHHVTPFVHLWPAAAALFTQSERVAKKKRKKKRNGEVKSDKASKRLRCVQRCAGERHTDKVPLDCTAVGGTREWAR